MRAFWMRAVFIILNGGLQVAPFHSSVLLTKNVYSRGLIISNLYLSLWKVPDHPCFGDYQEEHDSDTPTSSYLVKNVLIYTSLFMRELVYLLVQPKNCLFTMQCLLLYQFGWSRNRSIYEFFGFFNFGVVAIYVILNKNWSDFHISLKPHNDNGTLENCIRHISYNEKFQECSNLFIRQRPGTVGLFGAEGIHFPFCTLQVNFSKPC